MIDRVAIIGLGLIGGSLSMAAKESKLCKVVVGVPHREETLNVALKRGIIDEGTLDPIEGVAGADLIFVCTPINTITSMVKKISPFIKKGAIVTDVGSTKEKIVSVCERLVGRSAAFIGGHPMAGGEKVGLSNAKPDLFQGATYILTVTRRTNRDALNTLKEFVSQLGVKIVELSPEKHDFLVSGISHMPLAISAALMNSIANVPRYKRKMVSLSGGGFRDTTRIASGEPSLGVDIFTTNKENVLGMIKRFKKSLNKLESTIRRGNAKEIAKELERAKKFRDSIY